MALCAATLAHAIATGRPFAAQNHVTALHLTQAFLTANGCERAAPADDTELAAHIRGYERGTHALEDTARLFVERLERRPSDRSSS